MKQIKAKQRGLYVGIDCLFTDKLERLFRGISGMVQPAFEVYGFITHTVCTLNVDMIQIGIKITCKGYLSDHTG